jgi:hypothetical protein
VGNGLDDTIKYPHCATFDFAGNGLGATIK